MTTPARICGFVGLVVVNLFLLGLFLAAVDLCVMQMLPALRTFPYAGQILGSLDHSAESILVG